MKTDNPLDSILSKSPADVGGAKEAESVPKEIEVKCAETLSTTKGNLTFSANEEVEFEIIVEPEVTTKNSSKSWMC